jgi:hypothetical protein
MPDGNYYLRFGIDPGYAFTAQGQGSDGTIDSDVDSMGNTAVFAFSQDGSDVVFDAGYVTSGQSGSSSIGDRVWLDLNGDGVQDPGEAGLDGVIVRLLDSQGNVIATTTTAAGGFYQFNNLSAGTYAVQFVAPSGYAFSARGQGSDTGLDSDADPITGRTDYFTLGNAEVRNDLDAGLHAAT